MEVKSFENIEQSHADEVLQLMQEQVSDTPGHCVEITVNWEAQGCWFREFYGRVGM